MRTGLDDKSGNAGHLDLANVIEVKGVQARGVDLTQSVRLAGSPYPERPAFVANREQQGHTEVVPEDTLLVQAMQLEPNTDRTVASRVRHDLY